jgi:hypothetical protein
MLRIMQRPVFSGEIIPGRSYVLIDDIVTLGGTIASLIEFTQNAGGSVRAVLALAYAKYGRPITPTAPNLEKLTRCFGGGLNALFEDCGIGENGVGRLTNSEIMYLLKFKSTENIRKKLWSLKGSFEKE